MRRNHTNSSTCTAFLELERHGDNRCLLPILPLHEPNADTEVVVPAAACGGDEVLVALPACSFPGWLSSARRLPVRLAVLLLTLLVVAPGRADQPAAEKAPRVRLLVPAYFYPAGPGLKEWERLIAASARVPIVAVVNPASGPGKEADANYVKVLQ